MMDLDSQREYDIEVVRQVLSLSRNVYQTYKDAPEPMKRHILGIFWDRFVVRDRTIVEATPTELVRVLQAEKEVISSANLLPSSPIIITATNEKYLCTLRTQLEELRAAAKQNAMPLS
jgi:hypothetical protein